MLSYFEIFDLPASYDVDLAVLRQRYLKLQQLHHPDMQQESDQQNQLLSQDINLAYGVLRDDIKRAEHLMQLTASHIEPQEAKPEFLEEMWQLLAYIHTCINAVELDQLLRQYIRRKEDIVTQIGGAFTSQSMQYIADKIAEAKYYTTIIKALEDGIERATTN